MKEQRFEKVVENDGYFYFLFFIFIGTLNYLYYGFFNVFKTVIEGFFGGMLSAFALIFFYFELKEGLEKRRVYWRKIK